MTIKLFSEEKISGLIAILFGLLSIHEAINLYPYSKNLLTGDHAFPGLIGLLLLLFGIWIFFERKTEENYSELPTRKNRIILLSSILILFLYCFLIVVLGYVLSTLMVSIGLIMVIGKYRLVFSIFMGGAITAVLYFLFIVLLKTPFPTGYFGF